MSHMYDLIGDIHGHADALKALLKKLDYEKTASGYSHPERTAIFVGDFIDRGPKIRETLGIVRAMVESGAALAVMGNHEFNALCYHTPHPERPGVYLRKHNDVHTKQHSETLSQLSADELREAIKWFYSLPLWLELPELRVVHACWDRPSMDLLGPLLVGDCIRQELLPTLALRPEAREMDSLYWAIETVLKGKEITLPGSAKFVDKDGHARREVRIKWFVSAANQTFQTYSFETDPSLPDFPVEFPAWYQDVQYPETDKPVFFGHYWRVGETPELLASNVCCLDYSVAKEGFLCGYRWNGEQSLKEENFVWVA